MLNNLSNLIENSVHTNGILTTIIVTEFVIVVIYILMLVFKSDKFKKKY